MYMYMYDQQLHCSYSFSPRQAPGLILSTSCHVHVYSGAPLLWTPWGPGEVSCIERCPHFRGKFKAHLGHSKVSLIQRSPYFRGVL